MPIGAAIATSIGNGIACLIAIGSIFHSKGFLSIRILDNWRLDKAIVKLIFTISSAAMIEQLFMRAGFFIIAKIVNSLGTDAAAVNAIISNVMSLNFNIADGFSIGAATLVGQSLGELNTKKAFAYGRLSQLTGAVAGIFMFLTVVFFRKPISMCFTTDSSIASEAGHLLIYTSAIIFPQNIQWITNGILRGAGDTKYTARNAIISVALIRPILSYILCITLSFGVIGSWAGMFLDQLFRCFMNNIRFISLKWSKIRI